MDATLASGLFFESIAKPENTISEEPILIKASIPSNRFMKTVSYIFGYILSILLLFLAKMLINSSIDLSPLKSSDAALVSFTALIPQIIELPKKTKRNLFLTISALVINILSLFTYCGIVIFEQNKLYDNFFSKYRLYINVPLILLGLGVGVIYCISKENN